MDAQNLLTQLDHFLAELEWRFDQLCYDIWDLIDECGYIIEEWGYDASPRPPQGFDPLKTLET
jgi:hypothetical protein